MAEQIGGPSQPTDATTALPGRGQTRRGQKDRRNINPLSTAQMDGSISDSVVNPTASSRLQKTPKQRHQSLAAGAQTAPINHTNHSNGHQRSKPVPYGGSIAPATPAKEQAYAGPTFQSSPAPSSLPVPKFFSRSVPNVSVPPSLQARMDSEQSTGEIEESSPEQENASPAPQPPRHDVRSPLDVFFNADREERQKRQSTPNTKAALLHELDGDNMPSPRTVPQGNQPQLPAGDQQLEASTKALKSLLFNNNNAPPGPPGQSPFQPPSNTPSPFQRAMSGPSTPAPLSEQQRNYHYGNRQLSPMFMAARAETPTRPSGLRQGSGEAIGSAQPPPQQIAPYPQPQHLQSGPPHQHVKHEMFSRQSIDSRVSQAPPTHSPAGFAANVASGPSKHLGGDHPNIGVDTNPRNNGPTRDVKGMEDDLRRMLKLNFMS